MSARSKARKRALDLLFEGEAKGMSGADLLDQRIADGQGPVNDYTAELVRGVDAHQQRIDQLIEEYAEGWTLPRMPAVDRNVLRIGVFEVLWTEVPDAAAVSEAINLVRDLSTDESPGFVNGVLGHIVRDRERLIG